MAASGGGKGSAIISLVLAGLGVMSLVVPIPVILPVFGFGLGANGWMKEKRRAEVRPKVILMCKIGLGINLFFTFLLLFSRRVGH